jgi:O-antigen/teichoic acid export membrane protein
MPAGESSKVTGLTRRALEGTAWSTIATVVKQVLTLASVATVARILGPNAYGVMGMAALVILFIGNFRDLGTGVAIVQKSAISQEFLSSLFWLNLSAGIAFAAVVFLCAPIAAHFFATPELEPILRVLSLSLPFASSGVVGSALLNRHMRYRQLAIIDLLAAFVSYLIALTCALAGFRVWSLVCASIASSLTTTCGYMRAEPFRPRLTFSWSEVRSILHFSGNLSAFGLVNFAYRNVDNVIVGRVLGSIPLGLYQMAYNLMLTPLQNVSAMITQVLFPAFARIQHEDERFRQAYVRSCGLTALITFPVIAGMGVVADPLIRSVLGNKWVGAIPIFQILAPVGLVQSIQTTTGIIFQAKGRTDLMLRCGLLTLLVTGAGFLIGVRFGTLGVAVSYAISYLLLLVYPLFALPLRTIGLTVGKFASTLVPQFTMTLFMTLICLSWLFLLHKTGVAHSWFELLSSSALGAIVYTAIALIWRPPVVRDVEEALGSSDHPAARWSLQAVRAMSRFGVRKSTGAPI